MVAEEHKPESITVDDHKTVTIIVEGTPHEWPEEYITHAQVVTLEVPRLPAAPRNHLRGEIQGWPSRQT